MGIVSRFFAGNRQEISKEMYAPLSRRLLLGLVIMVGSMLYLLVNIFIMQVQKGDKYKKLSDYNRITLRSIEAKRGVIYDVNNNLLAFNKPFFGLAIRSNISESAFKTLLKDIDSLVNIIDEKKYASLLKDYQTNRKKKLILVTVNLSFKKASVIAENIWKLNGLVLMPRLVRYYPYSKNLAHILGYVKENIDFDLFRDNSFFISGYVGAIGLEKFYNHYLIGKTGIEEIEVNARGNFIRSLNIAYPDTGHSLYLSLDVRLQEYAMKLLEGEKAALVALDPNDFSILTMVSSPSFDPNKMINQEYLSSLYKREDAPILNRATYGLYPPASTIKPAVAVGALKNNWVDPNKIFEDKGFIKIGKGSNVAIFRDWKRTGQGPIDMAKSIIKSADTYYYRLGKSVPVDEFLGFLKNFGFGQDLGKDNFVVAKGLLPSTSWKLKTKGERWYLGDSINVSIGQGYFLATPLQLAIMTAIIANRGKIGIPWIVNRIVDQNSKKEIFKVNPQLKSIIDLEQEDWDLVIKAMEDVIKSPQGTAYNIRGTDYTMAGKTGTAEIFKVVDGMEEFLEKSKQPHALFVAFAPVKEAKIVVAVVVENGESGSLKAAPIARKFLDKYFEYYKDAKK